MSADEPETVEAGTVGEPGESGGMSERTAKAVLLVVACSVLAGIIIAFPYTAY